MFTRRLFTTSACLGLVSGCSALKADTRQPQLQNLCQKLESTAQGRLGVCILDTQTDQQWGWREDELFMMLSSFKLLASALVLHRVDQGKENLQRRVTYSRNSLVPWSPITEKYADGLGMTLGELCAATITTSDNTAANLILDSYGGPNALHCICKKFRGYSYSLGSAMSLSLNRQSIDGLLDTTSPRAMTKTMNKLLMGNALESSSRQQLREWLIANTTGGKRS